MVLSIAGGRRFDRSNLRGPVVIGLPLDDVSESERVEPLVECWELEFRVDCCPEPLELPSTVALCFDGALG